MWPSDRFNRRKKYQALIRRAQKSDREAIGRLWYDMLRMHGELDARFAPSEDARERWHNDFNAWLDRLSRRIYVAEVDGAVCGFVAAEQWAPAPIYQDQPGVYIDEIFIEPEQRGKGIGRQLVEAVREWAEELGVHQVRATVVAKNEDAAAFWREIGAELVLQSFAIPLEGEAKTEERRSRSIGFQI